VRVVDIRPGFVATPMTAHLRLPQALVSTPADAARAIVSGIDAGRPVVYAPGFWRLIMFVVRSIPDFVFRRMKL
jgi:short-subunit dehydrogenase